MHHTVPEEFKPALFENGKQIPFPKPSKVRPHLSWTSDDIDMEKSKNIGKMQRKREFYLCQRIMRHQILGFVLFESLDVCLFGEVSTSRENRKAVFL